MTAIRLMAMRVSVALAVLLAFAAMFGVARSVGAQEPGPGEASIYFIAFACPDEGADPYVDCDILDGASFSIQAGGVELAGSPFATGPTSLVPVSGRGGSSGLGYVPLASSAWIAAAIARRSALPSVEPLTSTSSRSGLTA
ncbi:hypothetical protein BH23CHL4_BH23CHL4_04800 [soil metagenome]